MRFGVLAAAIALVLIGAVSPLGAAPSNVTRGCVDAYHAGVDYFPDKVTLDDAVNFSVTYQKSYKVVTLKETSQGGPVQRYVLVQCGTPAPALTGELAGAQIVPVPIKSLFAFSPTQLALLIDLDRLDVLTGVSRADSVDNAPVQARIKEGKVVEFARVGLVIDVERVVTSKPTLLMAGGLTNATLAAIKNAGIPVVANNEWLEPTAIARAEWLKYMAVFVNEERRAETLHRETKARYSARSRLAVAVPDAQKPRVMSGRSTSGTFVTAGGRSYVAALIKDAGGRYVWADDTSAGTISIDLEAQLTRAADADVWINGGGWKNLPAMLEDEPRYARFKAFRDGRVWVYERRLTPAGANDYWSRSVTHPDLLLADLVKIFHPTLATDHAFEWYMAVPPR